jgi:hypothetical protein
MLDLPHDWSIEDLSYAPTTGGGDTTNPSLLVYLPAQPNNPNPPDVIGPFDKNKSAGQGSTGYMVGGIAWYRKTFTTEDLVGRGALGRDPTHVELRFDGIYQNASVYLNGNLLETHPYGYTPISLDLTPGLTATGNNVVAVRGQQRADEPVVLGLGHLPAHLAHGHKRGADPRVRRRRDDSDGLAEQLDRPRSRVGGQPRQH